MTHSAPQELPRKSLFRRLTATLTAAAMALALTGASAAPARADGEDVAKIIAGIAALAIIAKAIDNKNDRKDKPVAVTPTHPKPPHWGHDRPRHDPPRYGRPHHDDDRYGNHRPDRPRYDRPRHDIRSPELPRSCALELRTRQGQTATVYSARCLDREGFSHRLPRQCASDYSIRGRTDRVYDARCLVSAGFRTRRG
ncbi:hypothetical protein GEU84_018215 [Fertoebacter nigrum]|uniref:Uncharacterized protein n=1 Tax=Fertoeibacter niger TaxID=2656921 RepID=A0A8X8H354_9RHOB|nr:hypothetical protein [Fertoeibacter niger]NUB46330.1 hypothetical protein [Fertoeibacter niger]